MKLYVLYFAVYFVNIYVYSSFLVQLSSISIIMGQKHFVIKFKYF